MRIELGLPLTGISVRGRCVRLDPAMVAVGSHLPVTLIAHLVLQV
jgi:hypothetical protein